MVLEKDFAYNSSQRGARKVILVSLDSCDQSLSFNVRHVGTGSLGSETISSWREIFREGPNDSCPSTTFFSQALLLSIGTSLRRIR